LRERLSPRITSRLGDTAWVVEAEQVSFDGRSHLWLALEGDRRETIPTLSGNTVAIHRPAGGPVRLSVRVTTDVPALTPLSRSEIFNDDFRRFYERVRADTAHRERFRRLEREVRGTELLCYGEKLRSEEHTSELQSRVDLVCRLLLEKKNNQACTRDRCVTV